MVNTFHEGKQSRVQMLINWISASSANHTECKYNKEHGDILIS